MTDVLLKISTSQWRDLWCHLLPRESSKEQAAFLYCSFSQDPVVPAWILNAEDAWHLGEQDFQAQLGDFIQLSDDVRRRIIQQAHKTETCLVELHSHPGPWSAVFSLSDRLGLQDTVRHMQWRLKGRPYGAIVVAPSGFDGLIWLPSDTQPRCFTSVDVDGDAAHPTNLSIGDWNGYIERAV